MKFQYNFRIEWEEMADVFCASMQLTSIICTDLLSCYHVRVVKCERHYFLFIFFCERHYGVVGAVHTV